TVVSEALVAVAALAGGIGMLPQQPAPQAPVAEKPAEQRRGPRTDLYGDPLPEGAVARLGSIQLRHPGLSDFAFLDGGKTVLTVGTDRVLRFWDVATGKQVHAVKLQTATGWSLALCPDGKTLAGNVNGKLVFWATDSG